jgi:hypothetical protein
MTEVKNKLKNQITMNEFENEVQLETINVNKTTANKKKETQSREKMN